jgi:hypothetical protein
VPATVTDVPRQASNSPEATPVPEAPESQVPAATTAERADVGAPAAATGAGAAALDEDAPPGRLPVGA